MSLSPFLSNHSTTTLLFYKQELHHHHNYYTCDANRHKFNKCWNTIAHNIIVCAQAGVMLTQVDRGGGVTVAAPVSHFNRCGASTAASRQHFSALILSDREESELSMPAARGSTAGHIWNLSHCAWQLISKHGFGRGLLSFWMTLVQLCIKSRLAADSPALWHLANRHRLSPSSHCCPFIDGFLCDCCVIWWCVRVLRAGLWAERMHERGTWIDSAFLSSAFLSVISAFLNGWGNRHPQDQQQLPPRPQLCNWRYISSHDCLLSGAHWGRHSEGIIWNQS